MHLKELPKYIQLAYLLLLATLARANDVFQMSIHALKQEVSGQYVLEYVSSKNHRFMRVNIDDKLAEKINAYIKEAKGLREELGSDILLVYSDERAREGSARQAQVLNSDKFNNSVNKLLRKYSNDRNLRLTARQICAEGGRRYHAAGESESYIAQALGNTPAVAKKHYGSMTPLDTATLCNEHYNKYFTFLFEPRKAEESEEQLIPSPPIPLFGTCTTPDSCSSKKSCSSCPYITIKQGGCL